MTDLFYKLYVNSIRLKLYGNLKGALVLVGGGAWEKINGSKDGDD